MIVQRIVWMVLVVVLTASLSGCEGSPEMEVSPLARPGSANNGMASSLPVALVDGQQLFQTHCMGCHTPQHLQKGPIHHFIAKEKATLGAFIHLLRFGSPNSGYMRQFSKEMLSDDDAETLYQWLTHQVGPSSE